MVERYRVRDPVGGAGVYFHRAGKLYRLLAGFTQNGSYSYQEISPDGCKTAFGYAPTLAKSRGSGPGPFTVRIFDACG